jgi:hypothetical protein
MLTPGTPLMIKLNSIKENPTPQDQALAENQFNPETS